MEPLGHLLNSLRHIHLSAAIRQGFDFFSIFARLAEFLRGLVILQCDNRERINHFCPVLICMRMAQLVQQRVASLRETQKLRALGQTTSGSSHALTQQQHRQQDSLAEHRFIQSVLDLHDKFKSLTVDCFRALPRPHEAASSSSRISLQVDPLFQKALKEG